jgi:hypothetical protein
MGVRDGAGHRAYRRQALALKHRTQRDNLPCTWCGQPIDTTLPWSHRMSFTADHPIPLAAGGTLLGQDLQPQHRACNAAKGATQQVNLDAFTAT